MEFKEKRSTPSRPIGHFKELHYRVRISGQRFVRLNSLENKFAQVGRFKSAVGKNDDQIFGGPNGNALAAAADGFKHSWQFFSFDPPEVAILIGKPGALDMGAHSGAHPGWRDHLTIIPTAVLQKKLYTDTYMHRAKDDRVERFAHCGAEARWSGNNRTSRQRPPNPCPLLRGAQFSKARIIGPRSGPRRSRTKQPREKSKHLRTLSS